MGMMDQVGPRWVRGPLAHMEHRFIGRRRERPHTLPSVLSFDAGVKPVISEEHAQPVYSFEIALGCRLGQPSGDFPNEELRRRALRLLADGLYAEAKADMLEIIGMLYEEGRQDNDPLLMKAESVLAEMEVRYA